MPRKIGPGSLTASVAAPERPGSVPEVADLERRLQVLESGTPGVQGFATHDPCRYCGVTRSLGATQVGSGAQTVCGTCNHDRGHRDDEEWRGMLLTRVLTGNTRERTVTEGDAHEYGIRFFHEVPGARGSTESWAHLAGLDVAAIRECYRRDEEARDRRARVERARARVESPTFHAGEPCPKCGCAYMWTTVPDRLAYAVNGHATGAVREPAHAVCGGCAAVETLDDLVERVIGVRADQSAHRPRYPAPPVPSAYVITTHFRNADGSVDVDVPKTLGVTWFADRDARGETPEDLRVKTLNPFTYLGNVGALRHRAFALWPFEGQWRGATLHNLTRAAVEAEVRAGGARKPAHPVHAEEPRLRWEDRTVHHDSETTPRRTGE